MGETTLRRYEAEDTTWGVAHQDADIISNFVVSMSNGGAYHGTLVTEHSVAPKPEDRNAYRTFKLFEHDRGEGHCGTCRVTLRRSPAEWMIQVEEEEYFPSENEVLMMTRATRASVENPNHEKLADGPHIEVGYGYANPRRIGGAPIKLELAIKGWSPQLASQMMSVRKFAKSLDLIGKATFFSALVDLPAEYADSIWHDLRHGSEA